MKVSTPIPAQLCHVRTLLDLHRILVSLPLLPLPCQWKGHSLFINNIKSNSNRLSLLSTASRLWVWVAMEVLQTQLVIYNNMRSAFTPVQGLLYSRITGFFKISYPPICWRKSRWNMLLLCSFPNWSFEKRCRWKTPLLIWFHGVEFLADCMAPARDFSSSGTRNRGTSSAGFCPSLSGISFLLAGTSSPALFGVFFPHTSLFYFPSLSLRLYVEIDDHME